jgi:hypothetical protein
MPGGNSSRNSTYFPDAREKSLLDKSKALL